MANIASRSAGALSPNPHLFVQDTGTAKGRGVFTHRPYAAGELVETVPVTLIQTPWGALPPTVQQLVYDWGYLCGDPAQTVHALALGVGSLFNHAQPANLVFSVRPAQAALAFTAAREIAIGEELTIDYNQDIGSGDADWFSSLGIHQLP